MVEQVDYSLDLVRTIAFGETVLLDSFKPLDGTETDTSVDLEVINPYLKIGNKDSMIGVRSPSS